MQQTPRPDRTALPHPHPRQNSHVTPDPAVLLNHNIPPQRLATTAHPPSRINRVGGADELDIRAEDASRSDGDGACV